VRPFTSIVCAVDFSDESRHALDHAALLAKWYGAQLTGVYVYAPVFTPIPEFALPGGLTVTELAGPGRIAIEQQLAEFLRPLAAVGVVAESRVAVGDVATEIVRAAAAVGADLVVMGTHGTGGFQHLLLGSVAEKVLRKAGCPVLTVPPRVRATSTLPFQRLLCPVDFGDPSRAALGLARALAAEGDSDLVLLHVLEPGGLEDDEPLTYRGMSVPEYHQAREHAAAAQLAELAAPREGSPAVRLTTRLTAGKAYREILGVAVEERIDLIIMGVHGRNPLEIALFGSTTNQVIRRATCPVLTVRG
jgi:nucleotide-binding universal stress UspA family protein